MAYLDTNQIRGTAAIPHAVYGGKVYSFKTAHSGDIAFDGDRLRIGLDGNVYAVFRDGIEAERHERCFADLPIACFGQFENAFDLGKPE